MPRDAYFLHDLADKVTIARKYGSFEGAENDTGIFYTEQPFLLAVYTQSVGEQIVALAADLAYDYNLEQTRLQRQAQNQAAADAAWAAAIEAQRARFAADQAASAEARVRIDAEKAAAEAERLAAEQAEAARLAAEAAQADEKSWADQVDDPDFVFAWWMIPVALGTFALGGGIVLLSLRSASRRHKKYTGKYVRK